MKLGDVSPLVGRGFVASSGNVARGFKLGFAGIAVRWRDPPTAADATEYDEWAIAILGPNFEPYSEINSNSSEAKEAHRKWLAGRK